MKIRVTIMTENDKPRPEDLTENMVTAAWQTVLGIMCLVDGDSKITVESAEFVEDGDGEGGKLMLYTRKQMEREIDRRLHEEYLRRSMEEEISQLHKRVTVMEDRLRMLEYKVAPENVLTNTEVRA